jgi:methyltransferase
VVCQAVRFHSMKALGESWTHLPVAYRGQKIVRNGLYAYFRHPNYLVVAVEIAVVPLLAKAYWTAAIFSLANAIFLYRRIRTEEALLEKVRTS